MFKKKHFGIDLRSVESRRCNHDLVTRYFVNSRTDTRKVLERRSEVEQSSGCVRINHWISVEVSKLKQVNSNYLAQRKVGLQLTIQET